MSIDTRRVGRTSRGMQRSLLVLTTLAGLVLGCDPAVETTDVGRVEVEGQLDCYRWGTSVLRLSRTEANPDFVAFSEGDLYYAGTPGAHDILRTEGRSGTRWVTSVGGLLDGFVSDLQPHPDGGVVAVASQAGRISVARVATSGEASLVARIESDTLADTYALGAQIAVLSDGYAIATLDRPPGVPTEAVVRRLDTHGAVVWTRVAPVTPEGGSWALALLRIDATGGVITAAVNDSSARAGNDLDGVRILQWDEDGTPLTDVALSLAENYSDIAFRADGSITLLSSGFDTVEVRHLSPSLEMLWSALPRTGHDIAGNALAWDDHTDRLLVVGENRPSGGMSNGWFMVFTPEGDLEWEHTASGDVGGLTSSVVPDPAGGFVMPEWRAEMRVRQFLPTSCG